MRMPLVSFCIPVHNSESYVEETLYSLLNQSCADIEVVCVDDHSTDNSLEVLQKFKHRIKIISAEKRGASAARNLAFENSSGDFIVFMDSDDMVSRNYVETQTKPLRNSLDAVVICLWGRFHSSISDFEEDENMLKRDLTFHEWITQYWTYNLHTTPPGRIMIPRNIVCKSGGWNESLSLNDDLDFFSRVFNASSKILFNKEAVFYYRSGIGGLSSRTKGFKYQQSNWLSFESATTVAALAFPGDKLIHRACANMWQQFVYENYPYNTALTKEALTRIKNFGGSDFPFPAGGYSEHLRKLIGWKFTKRLQLLLK